MTQSNIELGHFGGWDNRGIIDVTDPAVVWGDPMIRNVEVTPTDDTASGSSLALLLPETSRVTIGAEYSVFVFNDASETTGRVEVQDASGDPVTKDDGSDLIVIPEVSGDGNMVQVIFDGSSWRVTSPFSSGQVDRAATYQTPANDGAWPLNSIEVDLYQNIANLNALDVAMSNGYSGGDNLRLVIRCHSMVIGSTEQSAPSFTTGGDGDDSWGSGCSVRLELENSIISGWGGEGGDTLGTSNPAVETGPGDGGDAVHAYVDLLIVADGDSRLTPGGGGGPSNSTTPGASSGGGGNGGNMTSGGALTGSSAGAIEPGIGSSAGGQGFSGELVGGGSGGGGSADSGASWGGGVTGSSYSSSGGIAARAKATPPAYITWSTSDSFRWGDDGVETLASSSLPSTVGDL